jgi:hypothetical protein
MGCTLISLNLLAEEYANMDIAKKMIIVFLPCAFSDIVQYTLIDQGSQRFSLLKSHSQKV